MLQISFKKSEKVILGGNLNFTLGTQEVWGSRDRIGPVVNIFEQKLREGCLIIDLALAKLKRTWTNKRTRESKIAKRIDTFIIMENLIEKNSIIREWLGLGDSYHYPIYLEVLGDECKRANYFKFCATLLKEE